MKPKPLRNGGKKGGTPCVTTFHLLEGRFGFGFGLGLAKNEGKRERPQRQRSELDSKKTYPCFIMFDSHFVGGGGKAVA